MSVSVNPSMRCAGLVNPDPFLYSNKNDWSEVSGLFGSITVDFEGRIDTFVWSPIIQTFPLKPFNVAPAPAGTPPSAAFALPVQQVVAGTSVRFVPMPTPAAQ